MKKIFLIAAAVLILTAAATAFADISASVYMTGSLYGTDGFMLNNQNQKDADLLQFSIWGENTGAEFKLWSPLIYSSVTGWGLQDDDSPPDGIPDSVTTTTETHNEAQVIMRSIKLWWIPVKMLKLSIGNVGAYGYTEQLDWWKTPTGSSISQFLGWESRWFNNSTGENGGMQVDLDPVEGLSLSAGVYPGIGNLIGTMKDDPTTPEDETDEDVYDENFAWGVQAKYNITDFGSVLAAFKDDGLDDYKIGRIGFDVNAVPNLYAFLTGIFYMDDHSDAWTGEDADGMMLRGIAIDSYIKYTLMEKLTLEGRFPVTIRLTDIEGDDSFMTFRARAKYALDGYSPYLNLEVVDDAPLNFSDIENTFTLSIRPGIECSIEHGWFDVGIQIDIPPADADMTWKIPFQARVSF